MPARHGYPDGMDKSQPLPPQPASALLQWRLLALLYDLFPALALWMLVSSMFTLGYFLAGHAPRQNIAPFSPLQLLLWFTCWLVTGAYAVISWERGGRTLGMRPWRLRVVDIMGAPAPRRALVRRYAIGTLSLVVAGMGFWWALFNRDGLTWHDRASATRMIRSAKNPSP